MPGYKPISPEDHLHLITKLSPGVIQTKVDRHPEFRDMREVYRKTTAPQTELGKPEDVKNPAYVNADSFKHYF